MLDLTAEFYLETIDKVFQRTPPGRRGELDLQGASGRTRKPIRKHGPAHRRGRARRHLLHRPDRGGARPLLRSLQPYRKRHHMQAGVGHYGVFSGRKWEGQVYPIVRNMILASE